MNTEESFQCRKEAKIIKYRAYNLSFKEILKESVGIELGYKLEDISWMWRNLTTQEKNKWGQIADSMNGTG